MKGTLFRLFSVGSRVIGKLILIGFVLCTVIGGTLILSQEGTSPVRTRLLLAYGVEYAVVHAVVHFKPIRHWFPEPYLIDLETK